jgi:hypothetical protein
MIKMKDYLLSEDVRELYEGCDIYLPEDFDEYFKKQQIVDEIYETATGLLSGIYHAIAEAQQEMDQDNRPQMSDYDLNPNVSSARNATTQISREHMLFGRPIIKALNQFPQQAMAGILGRSILSSDPTAARYIGDGFYGALAHRAKGNTMSNFTCEVRFIKNGYPSSVWDPHTLGRVPTMGAVLSPGREAVVRQYQGMAAPNPHKGYENDGKDDVLKNGETVPGKTLFNGTGNTPGFENMAKGVYMPHAAIAKEMEAGVGQPMRHYKDPVTGQMIPMAKQGMTGTTLQPPDPDDPDSYIYYIDPVTKKKVRRSVPAAAGYKAQATPALRPKGRISARDRIEAGYEDQPTGSLTGGGSQTIDKRFRTWLQRSAENPEMFNRRYQNWLLRRKQLVNAGDLKYRGYVSPEDQEKGIEGAELSRADGDPHRPQLQTVFGVPQPMGHFPNIDKNGNVIKRSTEKNRRTPVAQDPTRVQVMPAIKRPLTPDEIQQKASAMVGPEAQARRMQWYNSIDPSTGETRLDGLKQAWQDADERGDTKRANQLITAIQQATNPNYVNPIQAQRAQKMTNPQPQLGFAKADFGRGRVKIVDPQNPTKTRRGKEVPNYIAARERKPGAKKDSYINQTHKLEFTKRVIPRLYSLTPVGDPKNPFTISKELADEIKQRQGNLDPQEMYAKRRNGKEDHELRAGDQSISDRAIRDRVGAGYKFIVGAPAPGGRFFVHTATKKGQSVNALSWSLLDKQGLPVYIYEQRKAKDGGNDMEAQEQPILSPGVLNRHLKNGIPPSYGGIEVSPQGHEDQAPHSDLERKNRSLFGDPDENGNYDDKQDVNTKNPKGWSTTIQRQVNFGVKLGIDTLKYRYNIGEDILARIEGETDVLSQMAFMYAQNNLANGKFLDTKQGHDTYFNMRYMKDRSPQLYAVIMQIEKLIKDANNAYRINPEKRDPHQQQMAKLSEALKVTKPPSKMTVMEFMKLISSDTMKNFLSFGDNPDDPTDYNHPRMSVRMKTAHTLVGKPGQMKFKKGYRDANTNGPKAQHSYDKNGKLIIDDDEQPVLDPEHEVHGDAVKGGYVKMGVDYDAIIQMMDDARTWYLRWIGKDMVLKTLKIESRAADRGTFADKNKNGLDNANKNAQEALRELAGSKGATGQSRHRGTERFARLIENRMAAPRMIQAEVDAMEKQFQNQPSLWTAAKVVSLRVQLGQAVEEHKALRHIKTVLRNEHDEVNPDTGEPWTEESQAAYIIAHLPDFMKHVEEQKDTQKYDANHETQMAMHDDNIAYTDPNIVLQSL